MKVFISSTYVDLIEHRKAAHLPRPHGDELLLRSRRQSASPLERTLYE